MAKGSKKRASDNQQRADRMPAASIKVGPFSRGPVIHILIIVILGTLIYSNTFKVPFSFDDRQSIVDNIAVRDVLHYVGLQNIYGNRSVGFLTFALNFALHGLDVAGYHVFNLLIHLLNALLVYWLIVLTFSTPYASAYLQRNDLKTVVPYHWIPLFTALLFVCHPVQTQAVTYIVQRFASLATLFYLGSLVMYIKFRAEESSKRVRYACYAASIICAILAMRTKEIAFTLPVMVFLYEILFFQGDIRKRMLYLFPLLSTMLIIPLNMVFTLSGSTGAGRFDELTKISSSLGELTKIAGSVDVSRWDYLNTQFRVIVTYIRLLLLPINQNLDYDYPIYRTFFAAPVFLSFLLLVGLLCWGVYLLYRSYKADHANGYWFRLIAFGMFWFFVTLSVESSIIPILDVIFEHRLYLPSIGFFLAIMAGIALIYERLANRKRTAVKVFVPVMILVVMGLSLAAYARNMVWSNEVTLWEDVVKKSPHKARPHYNLGKFYQERGHLDDAAKEYLAAINIRPNYLEAHNNLGTTYQNQGRLADAAKEYQKVIELRPNYADAHSNLGVVYQQQGRTDEAVREYQTALKLSPDLADVHSNLGVAYRTQGRLDEAIKEYQTAIKLKLDYAELCYYNLGEAYLAQGRLDDAVREFQAAIKLKPDYVDAHYDLGVVYQQQGRLEDAVKEYQTVINLNANHADARKNLQYLLKATQGRPQSR